MTPCPIAFLRNDRVRLNRPGDPAAATSDCKANGERRKWEGKTRNEVPQWLGKDLEMIKAKFDKDRGILHVKPAGPLEAGDFDILSALADPYIKRKGKLPGLIVEIGGFPGWKNLAGMLKHFRFVRNHHRKVRRVALVTDARVGKFAVRFARHFVAAEVQRFPAGHIAEAKKWLAQ